MVSITNSGGQRVALLIIAGLFIGCIPCLHAAPEWDVTSVTDNAATPLAHDCRRAMSAGLYDHEANKTFVCFAGASMEPIVAAYDHVSNAWSTPVGIDIPDSSSDDHDYPHIFQSADGHLHITYSRHNASLWIATSESPNSIEGTWNVRQIGSNLGATYPMPIKGADGTLYILYRVTLSPTDYRPIKWVKSTDNGATWSGPQPCIDYNNSRSDNLNEIYLGQLNYEPANPVFGEGYSASWTIAGGGPTEHDHDDYHKNMYYAFFTMPNGHWRAADGTDLGTNIDDAEAQAHCLVYDSGALEGNRDRGERQDIGYTSSSACQTNGYPMVAFQNGKSNSIDIGIWDGAKWNVTTPETFEGTRGLHDMNRINGKMWLLEDDGNGARVVEYNAGEWTDVAEYHPSVNTGDNIFIDDARPEVMILSANDTLEIFSVGYSEVGRPAVDAGDDFVVILTEGIDVTMDASVVDPDGGTTINSWTVTGVDMAGNPIGDDDLPTFNVANPLDVGANVNVTVTFYDPGIYTLTLTADDGETYPASDSLVVTVYANSCAADKVLTPYTEEDARLKGDTNFDCEVNLVDFAAMAENWLIDVSLSL